MPVTVVGIDASRAVVPNPTGVEEYSRRVIERMVRLAPDVRFRLYTRTKPSGNEDFLAHPGGAESDIPDNVEWKAMPFPRLWTHLRLSWEMAFRSPDVLFVPSHVIPLVHPRVSFVTVHDLGYLRFPHAHTFSQRLYLALSTRWNVAVSRTVFAVSNATAKDLVERYGADESKVSVVYPGVNERIKRVGRDERKPVLEKYGLEDGKYVLYLGTIQPRKNLKRLIEAFARLPARDGLKLVIAGKKGWKTAEITRVATQLGLGDGIAFTGYVPEEEKAALISGAIVFAFVSLYEGFGFPVLEAQACGTPVLASNTSSLPEVAGDGAVLVDPTSIDAIAYGLQRLIEDEGLRADFVAKGRENVKRFSWDETAKKILEAILER